MAISFFKKSAFIFLTMLAPLGISASCFDNDCFSCCNFQQGWEAEFRIAYYSPQSKRFREIYSDNLVDYQIEVSKQFSDNWSIWFDVDYTTKKGSSHPLHDKTKIWMVPLVLGASYHYNFCNDWQAYAGAGLNYTRLKIHDESCYVKEHISKWDFGGTFKLGIKKSFCNGLLFDVFIDYFVQEFHFSNHSYSKSGSYSSHFVERNNLNANGIKVGAGIGYLF